MQLIRKEYEREGPLSCCRKVLIEWLNGQGRYQPANWENLIEILEDIDEVCLAKGLRDMFSLHQSRATSHAAVAVTETMC